jgi:hypothetical protein
MTMIRELVSGLIGAVIASLLTALYLWVTEVRKLRGEVFVETASFLDQIWQTLPTTINPPPWKTDLALTYSLPL